MSSAVFDVIKMLEKAHIYFNLERTGNGSIRVNATLVGERLEIEIFEDNHIELSRFRGNEDIEGEMELLRVILDEYGPPDAK